MTVFDQDTTGEPSVSADATPEPEAVAPATDDCVTVVWGGAEAVLVPGQGIILPGELIHDIPAEQERTTAAMRLATPDDIAAQT